MPDEVDVPDAYRPNVELIAGGPEENTELVRGASAAAGGV